MVEVLVKGKVNRTLAAGGWRFHGNRPLVGLVGALALAGGAGSAGCLPGAATRSPNAPPTLPTMAPSAVPAKTPKASLADRVAHQRAVLRRFIPGDDLIEHLYFAWMLEPYRRATLAVAVKTLAVLEREVDLRSRGAGVLTPSESDVMLDWLETALAGDFTPVAPGFAPDRIAVQTGDPAEHPALFAFADRASSTQADPWFGDFDLLACAGFRVYPLGRNRPLRSQDVTALNEHAHALHIRLFDAPLPATAEVPSTDMRNANTRIQSVTLGELLAGNVPPNVVPALIDPPRGESWAGMVARRALYRGAFGSAPHAVGVTPPLGPREHARERLRAAEWVQALSGQQLGVIEGWRDLRDGTPTLYPSQFTDPAYLETAAHTALDILRQRDALSRFRRRPPLAVVIDARQMGEGADDAWSPAFLEVVDALLAGQIEFDLLPTGSAGVDRRADYALAVTLPPSLGGPPGELETEFSYIRRGAPASPTTFDRSAGASLAFRFVESVRDLLADSGVAGGGAGGLVLVENNGEPAGALSDGQPAGALYVVRTNDGRGVAVVNLLGVTRSLRVIEGPETRPATGLADAVTGEVIGASVALGPYQVRLLVP